MRQVQPRALHRVVLGHVINLSAPHCYGIVGHALDKCDEVVDVDSSSVVKAGILLTTQG